MSQHKPVTTITMTPLPGDQVFVVETIEEVSGRIVARSSSLHFVQRGRS